MSDTWQDSGDEGTLPAVNEMQAALVLVCVSAVIAWIVMCVTDRHGE